MGGGRIERETPRCRVALRGPALRIEGEPPPDLQPYSPVFAAVLYLRGLSGRGSAKYGCFSGVHTIDRRALLSLRGHGARPRGGGEDEYARECQELPCRARG